MPIIDSTLKQVKYFPEMLPDAQSLTLNPGQNEVLALRTLGGLLLELRDLGVDSANAEAAYVQAVINGDKEQYTPLTAVLPPLLPDLDRWRVSAKSTLTYYLMSLYQGGQIANFRTLYNLLVYQPTVAQKIKYGITLTAADRAIDKALGITNSVNKGILPLQWDYMIEREEQVIDEATFATVIPAVTSTPQAAFQPIVSPASDQYMVLRSLAVSPGSGSDGLTVSIQRDLGPVYLSFPAYPLAQTLVYGPIKFRMPAMRQIVVNLSSTTTVTDVAIRVGVQFCNLTDIWKVRWGLLTQASAPGDVWNKVMGGVL